MNHSLLLPNKFKNIGWSILAPATIFGIVLMTGAFDNMALKTKVFAIVSTELFKDPVYFGFAQANIINTLAGLLIIAGGLLVAFSKEKNEDEFIANQRLTSLLWAVLVNYMLLFLAFAFVWGASFLNVLIYNMFTVLGIFIIRFNYVLYKSNKATSDEK